MQRLERPATPDYWGPVAVAQAHDQPIVHQNDAIIKQDFWGRRGMNSRLFTRMPGPSQGDGSDSGDGSG